MSRQTWWILVGCGFLVTLGGCSGAQLRRQPHTGTTASVADPAEDSDATQYLFRVHYAGPQGSGSLRLVLRMQTDDFFQLATADTLGRPLWSLEVDAPRSVFLDHRRQVYCASEDEIRLAEVTLEMFPVTSIPRLLLGSLPVDLDDGRPQGESTEYRDTQGRRWSVRTEGAGITAWTMWVADVPTLWWTRQGKGGILSHRDGSQFRWRQVVEEPTGSKLISLKPPEGFRQVPCHEYDLPEFRQDQFAPPGDGAAR